MIFGMMCVPRADGCSNDDRIFICSHGVAHVGRNEQEAANRVRLMVLKVGGLAEADLQYTLYDRNPGVAGMGVKVMESPGNECGVGEGFPSHIASSFEHRPLRSIGVDLLPLDVFSVPALRLFGLFGWKATEKNQSKYPCDFPMHFASPLFVALQPKAFR